MLVQAQHAEQAAKIAMNAAHAALIAAEGELAAAATSLNPFAVATATAHVHQAQKAFQIARRAYQAAKLHREHMEKRYSLAKKSEQAAKVMLEKLRAACRLRLVRTVPIVQQMISRLLAAHQKLNDYHAAEVPQSMMDTYLSGINDVLSGGTSVSQTEGAVTPSVEGKSDETATDVSSASKEAFQKWADYQLQDTSKPVPFEELHDRFNASDDIRQGLLQHLYENDENFRHQVDAIRAQAKTDPEGAALKVRKGMAGRLGEEIVKYSLSPYGSSCETQVHHDVSDGGFTKTDFVLHDLKAPIILGRGEGMGAAAGQSIAIEVKTGSEQYISHEKGHILRQIEGHQDYDASWVICSRDITGLPRDKQMQYREDVREAGSPLIGLLPEKSELDQSCLDFVRNGQGGEHND